MFTPITKAPPAPRTIPVHDGRRQMAKSKRAKRDAQCEAFRAALLQTVPTAIKIGDHQFRAFQGIDAAFGANESDYPAREAIPAEFYNGRTKFNDAVSALFFKGGTLADHGLKLKAGTDSASFYTTLRALLGSFAPKHEIKEATCAWLLSEHTEPA